MSDEAPASHTAITNSTITNNATTHNATNHNTISPKSPPPVLTNLAPPSPNALAESIYSPTYNKDFKPRYRTMTAKSLDVDDYFHGPRNTEKHSKWPYFLRLQGSVTPKMILPLVMVALWSTLITCVSELQHDLGISNSLLTVLGFVVALGLSFRSSSAYERYIEGRKYWAQLLLTSRNLARVIWIHTKERHDVDMRTGKADLLAKVTALNLINAFAVALKHRLRFEPSVEYPDLEPLIGHLNTFAGFADQASLQKPKESRWKEAGQFLGVSFAEENPRKMIKQAKDNLGNLPLEILNYLAAYLDQVFANSTLTTPIYQTQASNSIASLAEVLVGTERVLNTPLPIAYSIAISQITHLYVAVLPFQLFSTLGWITIPACVVASYIILGITYIGYEIENPFGEDVNDLPLDNYCRELAADIDDLSSMPAPSPEEFLTHAQNLVMYPLSVGGYEAWEAKSVEEIRFALKAKATLAPSRPGAGGKAARLQKLSMEQAHRSSEV